MELDRRSTREGCKSRCSFVTEECNVTFGMETKDIKDRTSYKINVPRLDPIGEKFPVYCRFDDGTIACQEREEAS